MYAWLGASIMRTLRRLRGRTPGYGPVGTEKVPFDHPALRDLEERRPGGGCLVTGLVVREEALNHTPTARSVGLARRRAARRSPNGAWSHYAPDTAVIVSELGTNALLHGCLRDRRFQARLVLTEDVLRIEVSDPRGDRPLG